MLIPQQRQTLSVLYFHQEDYSPRKIVIKGIAVFSGHLLNQEKQNVFSSAQNVVKWKKDPKQRTLGETNCFVASK